MPFISQVPAGGVLPITQGTPPLLLVSLLCFIFAYYKQTANRRPRPLNSYTIPLRPDGSSQDSSSVVNGRFFVVSCDSRAFLARSRPVVGHLDQPAALQRRGQGQKWREKERPVSCSRQPPVPWCRGPPKCHMRPPRVGCGWRAAGWRWVGAAEEEVRRCEGPSSRLS